MTAAALAAAWHQREIGSSGSKAAPRHGGGAAAARRHHQWRQRWRWGRTTKAAAVMVCGGEKNYFCVFSILMFGKDTTSRRGAHLWDFWRGKNIFFCSDGTFERSVSMIYH
jgi:hypothetical protein